MNRRLILTSSVALAACAGFVVLAGDLDPPGGAVAPTMKTLVDVEPRTAIRNDFDTLTPIVINASGSYYLAEDILSLPLQHGVEITADNVTLDLNGFTIEGNSEVGSLDGVHLAAGVDNATVRNGTIQTFGGDGVGGPNADNVRLVDLRLIFNADDGVDVGDRAIVDRCVAIDNGDIGFRTRESTRCTACVAEDNGAWGFLTGFYVELRDCVARGNVTGIGLGAVSTAVNCTSVGNTGSGFDFAVDCTAHQCTATSNGGVGIDGQRTIITDSMVAFNDSDGVRLADNSLLRDSIIRVSGDDGVTAGSRCQIIGCVVLSNTGSGIELSGDNNVVAHCNFGSNTGAGVFVPGDQNRIIDNHGLDQVFTSGSDNLVVRNSMPISGGAGNQSASSSTDPDTAGPWSNFTP